MEDIRQQALMFFALPTYAIVIGLEMILSYIHQKHYYTFKDTLSNIYLSTLNFLFDLLMLGICFSVLNYVYKFHVIEIQNIYLYWITLVLAQDFAFYWLHRIDHYSRFFWAIHVTHHTSQLFNLTTGFRSSVFQPLYRFVYFIPLSLLGFKSMDIMLVYAVTQIYGILIHTQYIGKLGFLEYFLSTPSHHRVHHASNLKYLDKNMGMVLIIWDKLFGTFEAEDPNEPVVYGLTKNVETPYHPVKLVLHEWKNIGKDWNKKIPFKEKLKYTFYAPGWSHDGSSKTAAELRKEM